MKPSYHWAKKLVGGRWVYALQGDPEEPVYKARYVAKGYSQIEGIDYSETFSTTARMESVRALVQIAVQNDWLLHQMDVKCAYLHAPIDQDVYVEPPIGYKSGCKVWKLNKSLYGLKQSGRNWHSVLHDYLKELDFAQSSADPCVFTTRNERGTVILLVWVDDMIICASNETLLQEVKQHLTRLIEELTPYNQSAILFNDNQGAIALVKNPVKHPKSKHIDIRYHFVRECYLNKQVVLDYVPSNDNIADIFKKPPKKCLLQKFRLYLFGF